MNINTLKKIQSDPQIRDHELIRKAIEEMLLLPVSELFNSKGTINKTPIRDIFMKDLSDDLNIPQDDYRISSFGALIREVQAQKNVKRSNYESNILTLSHAHSLFGIPRRTKNDY